MGEEEDDVTNVTVAQFFGTPDEAFLIKKNKKTAEKKGDDGDKNGEGRRRGKVATVPFRSRRKATTSIIQNVNTCIYFNFSKIIDTNYV